MTLIIFKIQEFPHKSETFILNQINTALDLGYKVKVLIHRDLSNRRLKEPRLSELYKNKCVSIINYEIPQIKIFRILKWLKIIVFNSNKLLEIIELYRIQNKRSLSLLFEWKFFQNLEKASVFHIQYGTNKHPIDLIKSIKYEPEVICSFHGHDAFFPINGFIQNNGYYDNLFSCSKAIIVNSQYLKNQVLSLGCPEEKCKVIPVSVDLNLFKPNHELKHLPLRLVTVSRLVTEKNILEGLEAISDLINLGYDIYFDIVGEGPQHELLTNYILENKLDNRVKLLGFIENHELPQVFNNYHSFIFTPKIQKNGHGETQGLALCEAMACGLIPITYDIGGVKFNFEDEISGFLIKSNQKKELQDKILVLYNSYQIYLEMRRKAIDYCTFNFGKNKIDEKWRLVYGEN